MGKLKSWYFDHINEENEPEDIGPSDEDYYGSSRLNGVQDGQGTLEVLIQRYQPPEPAEQVPF